jgi:cellulose biosynthesis protein BcsQ
MPAKVVCVASAKGGSGKTVLTAGFGHYLAAIGKRVLLIDTDAATNGLSLLYLNEVVHHRDDVYPAIAREREEANAPALGIFDRVEVGGIFSALELTDGLKLLPATYRFLNTEDVAPHEYRSALTRALAVAREKFDFIFLDAQAGADELSAISIEPAISDIVVIVSEYDPLSASGVERLKAFFPNSLTFDRTWILLNKVLPEFSSSLGDFLQVARYLSPIPWTADVVRAYAQRTLALDLERGNDYTLAITQTLKGLFGPGVRDEIDEWISLRGAALKEPIHDQIHDLQAEADGLVIERAKLERQEGLRRTILLFAMVLTILVFAGGAFFFVASSVFVVLATTVIALAATLLTSEVWRDGSASVEVQVEDARLRRREQLIEERLQRLETLAEAKPEELLRSAQ